MPPQRRRAEEIHRQARARVGEAANVARDPLAFVIRGAVETDAGDRAVDLARERAEPDRPAVAEHGAVDLDLRVLERDGGVEQHVAFGVGVTRAEEIDADRHVRVEARLEILRERAAERPRGEQRGSDGRRAQGE